MEPILVCVYYFELYSSYFISCGYLGRIYNNIFNFVTYHEHSNCFSVENGEGVKNNAEISRMNGFEASSETRHNFETILLRGLTFINCFAKSEFSLCLIFTYFLQAQLFVQFVEEKSG